MSLLSQYLMRAILSSSALVLVVLLAIAGLFEFIAELDDIQGDYQTPQAILFTVLRLPNLAFEMLPVAVLIGSLLGLGALASSSEIIVMRSAGLSVRRLAGMVTLSSGVLLVATGLIGEFIGPPLDFYARDMRMEARYQKDDDLGRSAWVKDGPVYLHLQRVNAEFEFGTIYLFRFNDENELASIAQAENSGIDEQDIQTTSISLNARYDWNQEPAQIVGWEARNMVNVTVRDVEAVGDVVRIEERLHEPHGVRAGLEHLNRRIGANNARHNHKRQVRVNMPNQTQSLADR